LSQSSSIIYEKDPEVIPRKIAGELLLVPCRPSLGETDSIYTLNETAARAWELIDGKNSLADICRVIIHEYDVDEYSVTHDLDGLFRKLEQIGAVNKAA
jgi:hypothetical protein